jgi:hypothetical protein
MSNTVPLFSSITVATRTQHMAGNLYEHPYHVLTRSVIITLLQWLQKSRGGVYEILCISPFWRLEFKVTTRFLGWVG